MALVLEEVDLCATVEQVSFGALHLGGHLVQVAFRYLHGLLAAVLDVVEVLADAQRDSSLHLVFSTRIESEWVSFVLSILGDHWNLAAHFVQAGSGVRRGGEGLTCCYSWPSK